ncbi:MAG: MATE family efflux transporter [Lachnospiraceae bacterium]|nr:MATE family efflux transporter [Lachnospiraceae bacterium]
MKEEKQSRRELKMLTDPIPKVTLEMAVPTIIAFLITSVYNLADTYFVSSLGTNATAAVSVNASLDQIIMMGGSVFAIGAASYISRLLGARKKEQAIEVLSTVWFIAFAFGMLILLFGTAFMRPMVRVLGATDTCETYAVQYATYVLLVAPLMASSFVMNQCLRAEGSALYSMIGMGFGGVLNCFLDPVFIFKLGLGVTGASMATAISKLVSFLILIVPYLKGSSMLSISIRKFRLEAKMLFEVVSVGSSSLLRNGLAVISAIVLNHIAGGISDSVLAGIGVSNRIMMFPFSIILGFGSGYQPVAGFNWGAEQYDRVRECYGFACRFSIIGSVVMGLFIAFLAVPIIRLFSAVDPHMQQIGALCIRLQCIALPVHAWVAMVNMLCASLGYAGYAIILATARQGSCFFPIVYPLAWLFGGKGVAGTQAAADLLTVIPASVIIKRMLRIIREKEAAPADRN